MARYSSWWKNLVAFGAPSSKFGKGISVCIIKYGALTMDFTSGINTYRVQNFSEKRQQLPLLF